MGKLNQPAVALTLALLALAPASHAAHPPGSDIERALSAMPGARVALRSTDGVPTFMRGDLVHLDEPPSDDFATAERQLAVHLAPVLAPLRLRPADLFLWNIGVGPDGQRHYRLRQFDNGVEVIGGVLMVHVDARGRVYAVNGSARGDLPRDGRRDIPGSRALARVLQESCYRNMTAGPVRFVYLVRANGKRHRAYEIEMRGMRAGGPVRDRVYVDAVSGEIVATHPQVAYARSRTVYSANGGTSLPGIIKRSEGQAATSDTTVNLAYDATGAFYDAYSGFWGRDSYDNAGTPIGSVVHYSTNYCNAFWDGALMVFGDGNGPTCTALAASTDITAHELTHAVTERESGLIYSGESGAINEAMSDIFGAFVESWAANGGSGLLVPTAQTWTIGEASLTLTHHLDDPALDGASADYYSSTVGNLDVHYSSGVGNLAFYLLSQGGYHPRGKSPVFVPGIGMDKAIRIFYEANVNILTPSSDYHALREAAQQAALALGYDAATRLSVACAFSAVGVLPATGLDPCQGTIAINVPIEGLADGQPGRFRTWRFTAVAGQTLTVSLSGGTGDADLYVRAGARPTANSFDCRPRLAGNEETCVATVATSGTYWVAVRTRSAYSGVRLLVSDGTGGNTGPGELGNGVPVTPLAGAAGGESAWRIKVPAGVNLAISINGGTGDADLYTSFGVAPSLTTYDCRPYINGNQETCTIPVTEAGTYYVLINGYTAYDGLTLTASYLDVSSGDPYLDVATDVKGAAMSDAYWRVNTPAGATLTVRSSGGTGDADLYVRYGERPTLSTYECRPFINGNNETCVISPTQAGDYYIMLHGFTDFSGVTLNATQ